LIGCNYFSWYCLYDWSNGRRLYSATFPVDKIGLSPVAVVFAVLAGAQLGGFLGMLIALPVAAGYCRVT
jgi:hypothetical protein